MEERDLLEENVGELLMSGFGFVRRGRRRNGEVHAKHERGKGKEKGLEIGRAHV